MDYKFSGSYSEDQQVLFKNAQEEDLKKICHYLKTDITKVGKIKFEVFDTREGKQQNDPNHSISRASARFKEMTIYRYWLPTDDPHFPHEITHLVAHIWTNPYHWEIELDTWDNKKTKKTLEMVSTSFMQEGLAIAIDDIVFSRKLNEEGAEKDIDEWCKEQIGSTPESLLVAINMAGFSSLPNKVIVPFTASFSKYLLLTYGVDKYKSMYVKTSELLSTKENVAIIEDTFGKPEKELLGNWKTSVT